MGAAFLSTSADPGPSLPQALFPNLRMSPKFKKKTILTSFTINVLPVLFSNYKDGTQVQNRRHVKKKIVSLLFVA